MDTAQEALFKAMLNNDWFTASSGAVEAPMGYFGYVHNHPSEIMTIRREFEDVLSAYGPIADEQIVGVWWASINNNGVIRIDKIGDVNPVKTNLRDFATNPAVAEAKKRFEDTERDYCDWGNETEPDDIEAMS